MQCLRSGPPKVSYLAPLAASFSAPLAAFPAGCRVLICPYYVSLGKKEQSTCDTFKGPDCTFDKVHLQIHTYVHYFLSLLSQTFTVDFIFYPILILGYM